MLCLYDKPKVIRKESMSKYAAWNLLTNTITGSRVTWPEENWAMSHWVEHGKQEKWRGKMQEWVRARSRTREVCSWVYDLVAWWRWSLVLKAERIGDDKQLAVRHLHTWSHSCKQSTDRERGRREESPDEEGEWAEAEGDSPGHNDLIAPHQN